MPSTFQDCAGLRSLFSVPRHGGGYAYGFKAPSPVQRRAILPIIQGRDVVVQSQSGTGKTSVSQRLRPLPPPRPPAEPSDGHV